MEHIMRQAVFYTFTFILLAPAFLNAATPQETLRFTGELLGQC